MELNFTLRNQGVVLATREALSDQQIAESGEEGRRQSESGWTGLWEKASASCFRLRTTRPTSRPKISDQTRDELRAAKIPAGKVLRSLREFTEDLFSLLGRWRYGANDFYENPAVRDLESA